MKEKTTRKSKYIYVDKDRFRREVFTSLFKNAIRTTLDPDAAPPWDWAGNLRFRKGVFCLLVHGNGLTDMDEKRTAAARYEGLEYEFNDRRIREGLSLLYKQAPKDYAFLKADATSIDPYGIDTFLQLACFGKVFY